MERVQYIAARRARFNAICGPVNIPYGTTMEAVDGFLERDGHAQRFGRAWLHLYSR